MLTWIKKLKRRYKGRRLWHQMLEWWRKKKRSYRHRRGGIKMYWGSLVIWYQAWKRIRKGWGWWVRIIHLPLIQHNGIKNLIALRNLEIRIVQMMNQGREREVIRCKISKLTILYNNSIIYLDKLSNLVPLLKDQNINQMKAPAQNYPMNLKSNPTK